METYVEFSPSGLGLHIWVHMENKPSGEAYYKSGSTAVQGQISVERCFLTVTERPYPGCSHSLTTVSWEFAARAFEIRNVAFDTEKTKTASTDETGELNAFALLAESGEVTIQQIKEALTIVPCSPNRKVQAAWQKMTGRAYEHYTFWLAIGMALHAYGEQTDNKPLLYIEWIAWSKDDAASYEEGECEGHWHSFSFQKGGITIATLLALASMLKFEYPRRVFDKKAGKITSLPMVNEFSNFLYLMNYYNIKLWVDDHFYVSGDEEVMKTYFSRCGNPVVGKFYGPYSQTALNAFALVLCQDSNWRGVKDVTTLVKTWVEMFATPLDLFKEWLYTPYNELPEEMKEIYITGGVRKAHEFNSNSTVEYLYECMNAKYRNDDEKALYFTLLKKTLMQLIKFREPDVLKTPFVDNGGMLILTGPENAYKSTFCKQLIPRQLEDVRTEIKAKKMEGDKTIRDFVRYFATKTIVQLDDCDEALDLSSSFFKNILSGNDMSFTDIYSTTDKKLPRRAVAISTTNKDKMVLSSDGTRRLWIIPVGKIDTDGMLRVNLHKLYNDLRIEFKAELAKGVMPWLLTQEEIDQLNTLNAGHAAMTDIDLILEEIWPTDGKTMPENYLDEVNIVTEKCGKVLTSTQVRTILDMHGVRNIKATSVEHALKRHCTKWTGLKPGESRVNKNRDIQDGKIGQNFDGTRYAHHRWIMPLKRED